MNKSYLLESTESILFYPFKFPGWQSKLVIGAALVFANYIIPIAPIIFLAGYMAKIMRDFISQEAEPGLPEWDDWGNLFMLGLKPTLAVLIYFLPAIACMVIGYGIMIVPMFMLDTSSYDMSGQAAGIIVLASLGGMALFFLGYIILIPLSFLVPPAIIHSIAKNSFRAAFRIWEWWAILRANLKGFFAAIVITSGVYLVLLMSVYLLYFTLILCFLVPVGIAFLVPYLSIVSAAAFGDAYRRGAENLETSTRTF